MLNPQVPLRLLRTSGDNPVKVPTVHAAQLNAAGRPCPSLPLHCPEVTGEAARAHARQGETATTAPAAGLDGGVARWPSRVRLPAR